MVDKAIVINGETVQYDFRLSLQLPPGESSGPDRRLQSGADFGLKLVATFHGGNDARLTLRV